MFDLTAKEIFNVKHRSGNAAEQTTRKPPDPFGSDPRPALQRCDFKAQPLNSKLNAMHSSQQASIQSAWLQPCIQLTVNTR